VTDPSLYLSPLGSAYSVAVLTRGTGAYAYTYQGCTGIDRSTVCGISFRGSLELGVVVGIDESPPARGRLLPLLPVRLPGNEGWGEFLCDLASMFAATPREVAGYCLFGTPSQGLKLKLDLIDPDGVKPRDRSQLAALAGQLTPAKRKKLMAAVKWEALCQAATSGAIEFSTQVAGLPGVTRPQGKYAKHYAIDVPTANLLGLSVAPDQPVPGTYLAGLAGDLAQLNLSPVKISEVPDHAPTGQVEDSNLDWQPLEWPEGWDILERFEAIQGIKLRRTQATWDRLRDSRGLAAELAGDINAGRRTLLIAPMGWMLERIWPALASWAGSVHRYRSEAGPSAVAAVLGAATGSGQVVCGLAGAWKLAAYSKFDRIVLIDPTHPAYQPEGAPWFDPRFALWRVVAGSSAGLDLVEMGLSAFDGATQLRQAAVMPPQEPESMPQAAGSHVDIDPLPLHLRQPGRRRLVYFNRLGQGRNLRCAECGQGVNCPKCNSTRIHYSGRHGNYRCPDCGWRSSDLLCRNCGTATLSSVLPGLEALTRRSGDALVQASQPGAGAHPETQSVFGTAKLLEPLAEFWPQEIVYVHADVKPGLMDDWHQAVDLVSRLCALYANPHLQYAYIVSAHLRSKIGNSLTRGQAAANFKQDMQLRKLAGLPPFGRLFRFRWRGQDRAKVKSAAKKVMAELGQRLPEAMLGLGTPYRKRDGFYQAGYAVNPDIGEMELQHLRFLSREVSLSVQVVYGPWGG